MDSLWGQANPACPAGLESLRSFVRAARVTVHEIEAANNTISRGIAQEHCYTSIAKGAPWEARVRREHDGSGNAVNMQQVVNMQQARHDPSQGSTKQRISKDTPERGDAVTPTNFFALRIRAARIADRPLIKTDASFFY